MAAPKISGICDGALPFSIALTGELGWKFPTVIPLGTPKVATLAEKTPGKISCDLQGSTTDSG